MKRTLTLVVLLGLVLLGRTPMHAHHSFAATYFEDKEQSVEGQMVQFMYRNPHSFVHVLDKNGVRWAVEWGGGGQLSRQGVTRDTLKYGDHVVITGSPGRSAADHRLRLKSVLRPKDGWKWSGVVE